MNNLGKTLFKNLLPLASFALVCGAIVGGVYQLTHERIAENREQARRAALAEVAGSVISGDSWSIGQVTVAGFGHPKPAPAYIIADAGRASVVVLQVRAPDGYSGAIDLLLALSLEAEPTVLGVRVVEHRETPGLGDKINLDKSPWILGFNGTSLTLPAHWAVRKDGGEFDQFTGATITPRSVVAAIHRALHSFVLQRDAILSGQVTWNQADGVNQ